jgi:hypothetical protein
MSVDDSRPAKVLVSGSSCTSSTEATRSNRAFGDALELTREARGATVTAVRC